ncbi:hypothetical protein VTK73DRAFT_6100 [Phialemonium thermophilum]|uniref:Uncharacterized protein n=1 Tax=Phialemonium thermophilum TaxID=223376 RepID=A0ABR3V0A0_9PEZI
MSVRWMLIGAGFIDVFSAGSSVCASINGVAGFNGGGFGGVTSTQTVGRTKSVVVVTRTNGSGSVITSFVTGPTGGSNNNGGSGGSGSNTNNGGSGNNSGDQGSASKSSSGSGLSKGAIAGIAVGAAVGGILACVLAFFLWRSCQRKQNSQQGTVTDAAGAPQMVQQPQPPPAAAPFVGGKPELDAQGRPTTSVSPVSQPQVGTGGSTQHSVVSTPSPAQGAGYQPPLQPTHELHAGNQWPQGYYSGQQQQVYAAAPAAGYGVPGSGVTQPYGRGYAANSGPYEMPASPPPRP